MDNNNSKMPTLCTAGCGFYGNEMFNNMCSKCYKEANHSDKDKGSAGIKSSSPSTTESSKSAFMSNKDDTLSTITTTDGASREQEKKERERVSRKHARSPSPTATTKEKEAASQLPSLTTSSNKNTPSQTTTTIATATESSSSSSASTPSTTTATTPINNTKERPPQLNKGRCFRCRVKVPLAKQTINKCRCEYVFCDSHRYPDRHDCDVDFAKLDRDTLAKNNPKLHERPKGGRSFQRIDSL